VSAATVFETLDDLAPAVGRELGSSRWVEIDHERVEAFRAATGSSDLGLLVLAMSNLLLPEVVEVRGASAGVNYGTGRVRFPATAAQGMRVRLRADLVAVDDVRGGVQTTIAITMEAEGEPEPVCTIESLSRWLR
jgi:acyl dehydratase